MNSENKKYRFIISGGGTGGHIYPAIAIAHACKLQWPDCEILFVGAEGKMEMQKVPEAGFKIIGLPVAGIQRRLTLKNLLFPFKLLSSIWKARKIIKDFGPDMAIGVGGYASWPVLYSAGLSGIPYIIQEQNSYAGLSNKRLSQKAHKICVAYPDMQQYFPADKIVVTGNPVRSDIADLENKKAEAIRYFGLDPHKPTLLVIGGSLGARTINESLIAGLEFLREQDVQVIWQTGRFYFDKTKAALAVIPNENIKLNDFISRMDLAYAAADVVVSRAGALSISELCIAAKPTILVPSPNVTADHQTKNAMALVHKNAAQLIKDELADRVLVAASVKLLRDTEKKNIYKSEIAKLAKPKAAAEIVAVITAVFKGQNTTRNDSI